MSCSQRLLYWAFGVKVFIETLRLIYSEALSTGDFWTLQIGVSLAGYQGTFCRAILQLRLRHPFSLLVWITKCVHSGKSLIQKLLPSDSRGGERPVECAHWLRISVDKSCTLHSRADRALDYLLLSASYLTWRSFCWRCLTLRFDVDFVLSP